MPRVSPEITFRNVIKSDAVEALILDKIAKIEKICDHLVSCRVAVEKRHEHQQKGRPYRVRIEMTAPPNHVLTVKKDSTNGDKRAGLSQVVRNAFDAAFQRVKKLTEQQQGKVKRHPHQETAAFVNQIFKPEGYGFLKTLDGREIYFHRNSVVHADFDEIAAGDGVRYAQKMGEKGPQATAVQVVDRPSSG